MQENSNQFENYVASVKTKSEDLIKNQFPQKIEELNKLLDSEQFSFEHQQKILYEAVNIPVPDVEIKPSSSSTLNIQGGGGDADAQNKKRKLDSAEETKVVALPSVPVTCNSNLSKHIDTVKPFIRDLLDNANLLKRWITFLIPKVEDGNNFAVSIQEDTLKRMMIVEFEADSFFDAISKYYINRGKIISEVAKYPHISDYRKHVAELDEREFLSLRYTLSKIRNHYATLYDLIDKNWDNITSARTSNVENLY